MAKIEIEPTTLNWIKNQNKGGGITPTGTINITTNGTYDVTNYAEAEVTTPVPTGTINITTNGTHNVTNYVSANVNVQAQSDYNLFTNWNSTQSGSITSQVTKVGTITVNSNTTSLDHLFYNFENLVEYSLSVPTPNSITNIREMFEYCYRLKNVTLFDTSNVTEARSLFYYCYDLLECPSFDFSNLNVASSMFYGCSSLTTLPNFNFHKVTDMSNFCSGSTLITFPTLNLTHDLDNNTINLTRICDGCINLVNFPELDFSSVYSLTNAFRNCANLSNDSLFNILESLKTLTNAYTGSKTLSSIGLSSEKRAICQTLSNWPDLVALGWSAS